MNRFELFREKTKKIITDNNLGVSMLMIEPNSFKVETLKKHRDDLKKFYSIIKKLFKNEGYSPFYKLEGRSYYVIKSEDGKLIIGTPHFQDKTAIEKNIQKLLKEVEEKYNFWFGEIKLYIREGRRFVEFEL